MKVYEFSYKVVYPAKDEEEARELLNKEIEDGMFLEEYSDWECKELPRDDSTEWLYRSFDNLDEE